MCRGSNRGKLEPSNGRHRRIRRNPSAKVLIGLSTNSGWRLKTAQISPSTRSENNGRDGLLAAPHLRIRLRGYRARDWMCKSSQSSGAGTAEHTRLGRADVRNRTYSNVLERRDIVSGVAADRRSNHPPSGRAAARNRPYSNGLERRDIVSGVAADRRFQPPLPAEHAAARNRPYSNGLERRDIGTCADLERGGVTGIELVVHGEGPRHGGIRRGPRGRQGDRLTRALDFLRAMKSGSAPSLISRWSCMSDVTENPSILRPDRYPNGAGGVVGHGEAHFHDLARRV